MFLERSLNRVNGSVVSVAEDASVEQNIYVRCFGGMGRTGTTICCWLLRHGQVNRGGFLSLLTRLRQADKTPVSWKAPENESLESFV